MGIPYSTKAVILDCGGALIAEKRSPHDPKKVEIAPGVLEGLAWLGLAAPAWLVRGAGVFSWMRCMSSLKDCKPCLPGKGLPWMQSITARMPHEPCRCRKPASCMVEQAVRERGISFESSSLLVTRGLTFCSANLPGCIRSISVPGLVRKWRNRDPRLRMRLTQYTMPRGGLLPLPTFTGSNWWRAAVCV